MAHVGRAAMRQLLSFDVLSDDELSNGNRRMLWRAHLSDIPRNLYACTTLIRDIANCPDVVEMETMRAAQAVMAYDDQSDEDQHQRMRYPEV